MKPVRRHGGTIAAVALASLLGVLLYRDRDAPTTTELAERKSLLFERFRPDEVTRFTLLSRGAEATVSPRLRDGISERAYTVTIGGKNFAADPQAVEDYLGKLELAAPLRRVGSVDRASTGLDAPKVRVDVTASGTTTRLTIGGPAPTPPGAAYAEVEGRGVFVIAKELGSALDLDVEQLRARDLFAFSPATLKRVSIEQGSTRFNLDRAPWGGGRGAGFRISVGDSSKAAGRADASLVDRIFSALGRVKADPYLEIEAAERALSREASVRLEAVGSGEALALEMGGACPPSASGVARPGTVMIVRAKPPIAACVASDVLEAVHVSTDEMRDARAIGAPTDEITEIVTKESDRVLDFARASSGFHLRAPEDRPIEGEVGRAIMQAMTNVKGTLDASLPANATGRGTITVRSIDVTKSDADGGANNERVETIDLFEAGAGPWFAKRGEDGAVLRLDPTDARALFPTTLALRGPTVLDEPIARFRSLRIERDGAVEDLLRIEHGSWSLRSPKIEGIVADLGFANDLATTLGRLRALRWVAARDDGSFGLRTPRIVVAAEIGDEGSAASTHRHVKVEVGTPTNDGAFARLSGDDAVFVLPHAFEVVAARRLLDRTVLMVEPTLVTRVVVEHGKKRVVAEQKGGTWNIVGGSEARDSVRAAAIRDAITDLMSEGAVSLGAPDKRQGFASPTARITIERGQAAAVRIVIGAGDSYLGSAIHYARREGIEATFAIAQSKLDPLFDAL